MFAFKMKNKMTQKNYLLRSLLFVPGNSTKLMLSASKTNADAIILDLEDSVLESEKANAREIIKEKVESGLFQNFHVLVRLNDRESGLLEDEIKTLTIEGIFGFILPKSQNEQDVIFLEKLLDKIEKEKGFPAGKFKIIPLIETTAAVLSIQKICNSSKRIIAVCFDVHNLQDLEKELKVAKALGFEGKLLLHPKEIELTHKYFTPSREEYERAKELLRLNEQAKKLRKKVAIINERFIGPPMIKTAKKIIKRYEMIKM